MTTQRHRVVIIGGGFGGLKAAQAFGRAANVEVTLIDKRNFHLFQPLLYQVATGALSPANIAAPLRSIVRKQKNTRVLMAEVTNVDPQQVYLNDGTTLPYDSLIVATGARHFYFGNDQWEKHAPGLKTIEDATELRRRILYAFEVAERESDPSKVREWLTFVVIGAGPTGVEMAGAVAEIAKHTLKHDFRRIDPTHARVVLIEMTDRVLPMFAPDLSAYAQRRMEQMGIEVMLKTSVTDVQSDHITYKQGEKGSETQSKLPTHNTIWSAGVQATGLGKLIAERTGAKTDKAGRVIVEADWSVAGAPNIYVIGDLASYSHQTGKPLPGVAQVAMQGGTFVAKHVLRKLNGEDSTAHTFHYTDLGSMATIGRAAAIAEIGKIHLTGFIGWLAWLFVHLMYIVAFENRVLIILQWGWNYVTRNRAARLITGRTPLLIVDEDGYASDVPEPEHVLEGGR